VLYRPNKAASPADGAVASAVHLEQELAILLERAMIDRGAEAVVFPTIVASGPSSAISHHSPGERAF